MVLVDTTVWVDHFRRGNHGLASLLEDGEVGCHPFIIEELACGHLRNRREIIHLLGALPLCRVAAHGELLHFIEQNRLPGTGIGAVDAHLLASARLSGVQLWSQDKCMQAVAARLHLDFAPA